MSLHGGGGWSALTLQQVREDEAETTALYAGQGAAETRVAIVYTTSPGRARACLCLIECVCVSKGVRACPSPSLPFPPLLPCPLCNQCLRTPAFSVAALGCVKVLVHATPRIRVRVHASRTHLSHTHLTLRMVSDARVSAPPLFPATVIHDFSTCTPE